MLEGKSGPEDEAVCFCTHAAIAGDRLAKIRTLQGLAVVSNAIYGETKGLDRCKLMEIARKACADSIKCTLPAAAVDLLDSALESPEVAGAGAAALAVPVKDELDEWM